MRLHLPTGLTALSAIASFGVASSNPASADGYVPPPRRAPVAIAAPVQAAPNWTGGQFGGHAGGSQLGQSFAEPGSNYCPSFGVSANYSGCAETPFAFSGNPTGFTIGGFLGYRMRFGNVVAGVEGDASWKDIEKEATLYKASTVFPFGGGFGLTRTETFHGTQSQGWDGSIRGRLGLLLTPSLLAYATGGLAVGEVCGSFSYYATLSGGNGAASGGASWCDTRTGYTVGGGLEMQLFAGWKGRIEYRFTDFGDYHKNIPLTALSGAPCGGTFACTGNARVDLTDNNFHTVRLGIAYDF